ncbi:MAG: hypothetical protein AAGU12_01485 [Clostridiales bacterium]
MLKKTMAAMIFALAILLMFPLAARADMGPKPSVVIDFAGLAGEHYYATLLSPTSSTGPHSALSRSGDGYTRYQEGDEDYHIFLKFAEYQDEDGFYFLQFFQDCSQSQQFRWTYYPPQEFKILLYVPERDQFLVSGEIYQRYAFDSYFTADVSPGDPAGSFQGEAAAITAIKSYDYTDETLSLLARILLTMAIELAIALIFGFREKRLFRFIILVNAVTQIGLNLTLNLINYYSGHMMFAISYLPLEIAVFIAEGLLYNRYLPRYSKEEIAPWRPWTYALAANAASYALGLALAHWIPGIF